MISGSEGCSKVIGKRNVEVFELLRQALKEDGEQHDQRREQISGSDSVSIK